jgi:hypothetical protein
MLDREAGDLTVDARTGVHSHEASKEQPDGVNDPPPPPSPPRTVIIPPGAWLDHGQLYMRDVLGHRYRVREDGTRGTKTSRPLGWTSRKRFALPPHVREMHLRAERSGAHSSGGGDASTGAPPPSIEQRGSDSDPKASGSSGAAPCKPKMQACAAMGLEGLEGKVNQVVVVDEPEWHLLATYEDYALAYPVIDSLLGHVR